MVRLAEPGVAWGQEAMERQSRVQSCHYTGRTSSGALSCVTTRWTIVNDIALPGFKHTNIQETGIWIFSFKETITIPGDGYPKYIYLTTAQCAPVLKHHSPPYDVQNSYASIKNIANCNTIKMFRSFPCLWTSPIVQVFDFIFLWFLCYLVYHRDV